MKKLRDPFSGLSHLAAAGAALVGLTALLVVGWGSLGKTLSLAIYGVSLVLLFGASAAYHLVMAGPRVITSLRKLDHSAIYLLIAGTYTPFCLNFLTGAWRWGMLGTVWGLALAGIVMKLFWINAPRWLSAGIYVVMGWLCLAALRQMLLMLPLPALYWLAAGGVVYTLGAVVYVTRIFNFKPGVFGFHEVWHIFVILGALAHYIGVLVYIAPL
ncbi:MAG: hemolysin III family protein [Chloroflexota bacterium]